MRRDYAVARNGNVSICGHVYRSVGPMIQIDVRGDDDGCQIYMWPRKAIGFAIGLVKISLYVLMFRMRSAVRDRFRSFWGSCKRIGLHRNSRV
jgi:hypothetical protein